MMANVNINIQGIYEYINFLSSLQLLEHCHCTSTSDNTVPEKLQQSFQDTYSILQFLKTPQHLLGCKIMLLEGGELNEMKTG